MIVVIGPAVYRPEEDGSGAAAGLAPEVAAAAAATGAAVEMVAKIGDDRVGDEILLALARARVGHLAILRDAALRTPVDSPETEPPPDAEDEEDVPALLAEAEAALHAGSPRRPAVTPGLSLDHADLALGLRYLRDYRVVVVVEPLPDGGAGVVAEAAAFAGAALVVLAPPGAVVPKAYTAATVLEAPTADPDGAFSRLVGRYAAGLDRGDEASAAFRAAADEGGWQLATG